MNKRPVIFFSVATIAAVLALVLIPDRSEGETIPDSPAVAAASVAQRLDYFASHGWEVEEIGAKNVTIPEDFSTVYEEYASLQDKQGMPLREYVGRNAQLYVYEVKNYSPESRKMLAELLVCDDTAIASMVYSEDGGSIKMSVS